MTQDGGKTWRNKRVWTGHRRSVTDIYFVNDSHGWILAGPEPSGHIPYVLSTQDGGESWEGHELLIGNPESVWFLTSREGWLIAKGQSTHEAKYTILLDSSNGTEYIPIGGERNWVCHTDDGGRTWEPLSWFDQDLTAIVAHQLGEPSLYVSGFGGFMAASNDKGRTWSIINTGLPGDLYRPACHNQTIVVPGVGGVAATIDGGGTWSAFDLDDAAFAVYLFDGRSGVIGASRGIYRFEINP